MAPVCVTTLVSAYPPCSPISHAESGGGKRVVFGACLSDVTIDRASRFCRISHHAVHLASFVVLPSTSVFRVFTLGTYVYVVITARFAANQLM